MMICIGVNPKYKYIYYVYWLTIPMSSRPRATVAPRARSASTIFSIGVT